MSVACSNFQPQLYRKKFCQICFLAEESHQNKGLSPGPQKTISVPQTDLRTKEAAVRALPEFSIALDKIHSLSESSACVRDLRERLSDCGILKVYLSSSFPGEFQGRSLFSAAYCTHLRQLAESRGVALEIRDFWAEKPGKAAGLIPSEFGSRLKEIDEADVFVGLSSGVSLPLVQYELDQVSPKLISLLDGSLEGASTTTYELECAVGFVAEGSTPLFSYFFDLNSSSTNTASSSSNADHIVGDNIRAPPPSVPHAYSLGFLPKLAACLGRHQSEGSPKRAFFDTCPSSHSEYFFSLLLSIFLEKLILLCCPPQFDLLQVESIPHHALLKARSTGFGLDSLTKEIDRLLQQDSINFVCISGNPGVGKTALMAQWLTKRSCDKKATDWLVFHGLGATPHASSLAALIGRVTRQLRFFINTETLNSESSELRNTHSVPSNLAHLVIAFHTALSKAASLCRGTVILALNSLDRLSDPGKLDFLPDGTGRLLSWLPRDLPSNVRLVASCKPGPTLEALRLRAHCAFLEVGEFEDKHRVALIQDAMMKASPFRAKATLALPEVQDMLVDEACQNPLFLKAFLSKLLFDATFESFQDHRAEILASSQRVDLISLSISQLAQAFKAIDREDLLGHVLTLILVSPGGLSEATLLRALGLEAAVDALALLTLIHVWGRPLIETRASRLVLVDELVSAVVRRSYGHMAESCSMVLARTFIDEWRHAEKEFFPALQMRLQEAAPHHLLWRGKDFAAWTEIASSPAYVSLVFPDGELNMSHMGIDMNSVIHVRNAVEANKCIASLNLNDNALGQNGAAVISELLAICPSITHLNLSNNMLRDEGATRLAHALRSNTTLTCLFLKVNGIGWEGARALAEALASNSSLKELNMEGNMVGAQGAEAFASNLAGNTSLRSLNLMYNEVGDMGATHLASLLRKNTMLQLGLKGNHISKKVQRLFPTD